MAANPVLFGASGIFVLIIITIGIRQRMFKRVEAAYSRGRYEDDWRYWAQQPDKRMAASGLAAPGDD